MISWYHFKYNLSFILCLHVYLSSYQSSYLQALPDDLKSKLSIDDEVASSPKEALSRASVDYRVKYLNDPNSPRYKLSLYHFYCFVSPFFGGSSDTYPVNI